MSKLINGQDAPDIELYDTDGELWRLSDRRGKMVVVHTCRGNTDTRPGASSSSGARISTSSMG